MPLADQNLPLLHNRILFPDLLLFILHLNGINSALLDQGGFAASSFFVMFSLLIVDITEGMIKGK